MVGFDVSDTTLKADRTKAAVYASAGIVESWIVNVGARTVIVNVGARTVEVHSSPDGERYAKINTLQAGDTLRPAAFRELAIAVSEILPKL